MEEKYVLTISEKQAALIKDALEEYFRIRMNQWDSLAESLALKNIDLSPEHPRHKEIFEGYIHDRDAVQKVLECAGRILWGNQKNPKTEEQRMTEDIWQVIRYELWKNHPHGDGWCVDSRPPLQMSEEPLPAMKKVE